MKDWGEGCEWSWCYSFRQEVQVTVCSVHCRSARHSLWLTLRTLTLPYSTEFCTSMYWVIRLSHSSAAEWDVVERVFWEPVMHLPALGKFHFLWLCWGCPLQSHALTCFRPVRVPHPSCHRIGSGECKWRKPSQSLKFFSNRKLRKGALPFILQTGSHSALLRSSKEARRDKRHSILIGFVWVHYLFRKSVPWESPDANSLQTIPISFANLGLSN